LGLTLNFPSPCTLIFYRFPTFHFSQLKVYTQHLSTTTPICLCNVFWNRFPSSGLCAGQFCMAFTWEWGNLEQWICLYILRSW
jgi:hypothetical protein